MSVEDRMMMKIGNMPEEWEDVNLGDVCSQKNEIIQPSGKGEHKFVGLEHVNPGEIRINKYQLDTDIKSSKSRFYKGDILYGKLRPYLDKAAIADFEGICSTDLLVLTTKNNKAIAEFLIYLIHSNQFIQNSISATSGTNHPRTSWKEISKFKFRLPPLPEQRRIAEVLGTVDSAIQKVGGAIERTERLKKGLMQRLLTKGIGHEKFKESEVGRVPEEWKVKTIGDIAETSSGGTPSRDKKEYFIGSIPWVKSGELKDNTISDTEEKITDKGLQNSSAKLFPKTTLLIALYGATVGKTGILGIDATTNQAVCAILSKKDLINQKFLQYFLISRRKQLISLSAGGAQPNISQEIIRLFKIPIPPLPEQRRIAEILSAVDRKLELERRRKEKLERVKKGLMNELLTGRKRVKI